jgi:hypothetical protein
MNSKNFKIHHCLDQSKGGARRALYFSLNKHLSIYTILMSQNYYHTSPFRLYIATSNIKEAQLGVFTEEFIPPNTYIDEYKGDIFSFPKGGPYVLEINEHYCIDAFNYPRCFAAMINDCSYVAKKYKRKKRRKIDITPDAHYDKHNNKLEINCKFVFDVSANKAYVYSNDKRIEPYSELFISYGNDYW